MLKKANIAIQTRKMAVSQTGVEAAASLGVFRYISTVPSMRNPQLRYNSQSQMPIIEKIMITATVIPPMIFAATGFRTRTVQSNTKVAIAVT